ncbi:MAG: basic amino acid ABC transporter substrate-binding protein [Ruminococcaceae bacterium]|nr:basic amino acid ABC transporter substrate-binding protein [Oscillospiraceae bacterium]
MKFTKILALLLAAIMCFGMLTACGGSGDDKKTTDSTEGTKAPADSNSPADSDAPADNTSGKVFKMGTNAAFPPYEYKEGEKFVGIDVEIADAIAKKLGGTLEIVDMEFDSIITAVNQGEVDFGIAGMTVTEDRLLEVDFTSSYATGVQVVIVKEGSDIKSLDDLEGKKIGVQLGTTGDIYATDDYGKEFVTQYGKGADAVIALKGGDVDAVIIDNEPAKAFVAENEGLTILDTEYAVEDYAIAVKKGNTDLLDDINEALEELTVDGTIDRIIAKYIKAE